MQQKITLLIFFIFAFVNSVTSQEKPSFLKKSDTLNSRRVTGIYITEAVVSSATIIGLNELWYADYPRSKFHFTNDNSAWLQMDKFGHAFSAYQLGRLGMSSLAWAGATKKNQLIYGASLGFVFLTAIEVLDGFSSEWGASGGDLIANAAGMSLLIGQELAWNEQRISLKYSFHQTEYASSNPSILGTNLLQQALKDYNGQTYWLSANLWSFAKTSKIPKWLNIAIGYGANGMLSGNSNGNFGNPERYRQFYASFDVDLTKIETKSKFLKTLLNAVNMIKIPAPTIEFTSKGGIKTHWLH